MTVQRGVIMQAWEGQGTFGPPGWTRANGVNTLLAPFLENWRGPGTDFARFGGIGTDEAQALLEVLPWGNLCDRQNEGPRCGALLDAAIHGGPGVELYGYLVSPPRWDERVTLDAIVVPGAPVKREHAEDMTQGSSRRSLWDELAGRYRLADGAATPDEILWMPEGPDGRPSWWLWWD